MDDPVTQRVASEVSAQQLVLLVIRLLRREEGGVTWDNLDHILVPYALRIGALNLAVEQLIWRGEIKKSADGCISIVRPFRLIKGE